MIEKHFTATGIVFNNEKKILMIHHKKLKVWLPPGGHVDENETPEEAVVREIYEETGIQAAIRSEKIEKHPIELERPFTIMLEDIEGDGTHFHIDMIYLCTALNEELVLQKTEANDIGWFSYEEILSLDTFENVRYTVKKAIEHIGV